MTLLDHSFIYEAPPCERVLRALRAGITGTGHVRDLCGIRQIWFDERAHAINVEYDASRMTVNDAAALMRSAGFALR
jgi:hypothetical protein